MIDSTESYRASHSQHFDRRAISNMIQEDNHVQVRRSNSTDFSQAITTILQIALVDLIRHLAIDVSVVVGHSSGEIAAAYCAGFLCHASAVKVAYFRGVLACNLTKSAKSGCGMLSVGLGANEIRPALLSIQSEQSVAGIFDADTITVSCINSPTNVTLSGPTNSLDTAMQYFERKRVFARKLKVDLGYHSPQMDAMAEAYLKCLGDLSPSEVGHEIRMISTVNSRLVTKECVSKASYWIQNLLSPVRFVETMDLCCSCPNEGSIVHRLDMSHETQIVTNGWLEIGPHSALKGPLREIFRAMGREDSMFYTCLLSRGKSAEHTMLDAVGQLHCRDFEADLSAIYSMKGKSLDTKPQTISTLPSYPFNHAVIYWEEPARSKAYRARKYAHNELLGAPVMDWNPLDARWRFIIKKEEVPWIEQHKVHDKLLYPAADMLAMAMEAIKQLLDTHAVIGYEICNASFPAPILLNDSPESVEIQTDLVPILVEASKAEYRFRIFYRRSDDS
jgi:acyl transferase domain-containing protein